MRVLFVHGWGYGPDIWDGVIAQLDPEPGQELDTEIECMRADLGFSGKQDLPAGHFDIAVGHSMGLLWLLSEKKITWDKLISISGFTKFSASDDFPQGVSSRVVERMIRRLPLSAQSVLKSFHELCDPSGNISFEPIANMDEIRLAWGLELLRDMDMRSCFNPKNTLVLADRDDQVVTKEMTSALFQACEITWLEGKGHLIPLTAPKVCCEIIQRAMVSQ